MNHRSATLDRYTPPVDGEPNESADQPRLARSTSRIKRTEQQKPRAGDPSKFGRGHVARGLRRIVIVVVPLLACVASMTASPTSAHADSRPATATVCFRSAYGWPFADATVYPQYLTTSGSYQPLNVSQATNSNGCTTWRLTGGYSYRFFANNFTQTMGSKSSGFSRGYSVWPGGSYDFGTWYVS